MSYNNPLVDVGPDGSTSLPVTRQSNISEKLYLNFLQRISNPTLAANTVIDSRFVTLQAGHGLTVANVGNVMLLETTFDITYFSAEILSVSGNTIELSVPIPIIFQTATTLVLVANRRMENINGSTTPVIFRLAPNPNQIGDITGISIATTSSNASDLTTFGGAPALTRGLLLRKKMQDGTYVNIFSFRDNFKVVLLGRRSGVFEPKSGNNTHGLASFIIFNGEENADSVIRLDGSLGEELQIVISEQMISGGAGNTSVQILAQGSTVIR